MTNQNNLDEKIALVPFNTQWTQAYQSEAERLQKKLGHQIIGIEHIGSTAIPNIYAKPIIDIMIGVQDLSNTDSVIKQLQALHYEYFGEANVPGRLYFRYRGAQHYNLALCQYQSPIWVNNLLFRDYLRSNPEQAKIYSSFKQTIFNAGADSLLKYSDLKHPIVEEIIQKARAAKP